MRRALQTHRHTVVVGSPALLDSVPHDLRVVARWVGWNYEKDAEGRRTKVLCIAGDPSRHASSTDPSTWGTFRGAQDAYEDGKVDGAGFVLGDGWMSADFDKCRDPETGAIDPEVFKFVTMLNTDAEVSVSGRGLHCIVIE